MPPNLLAWLKRYGKSFGPICELTHTGDALIRLGDRAGIPWEHNACRNSFITYRVAQSGNIPLTAKEAGNSPRQIEESYLELVSKEDADRWFGIMPPEQMISLFDWADQCGQLAALGDSQQFAAK